MQILFPVRFIFIRKQNTSNHGLSEAFYVFCGNIPTKYLIETVIVDVIFVTLNLPKPLQYGSCPIMVTITCVSVQYTVVQ